MVYDLDDVQDVRGSKPFTGRFFFVKIPVSAVKIKFSLLGTPNFTKTYKKPQILHEITAFMAFIGNRSGCFAVNFCFIAVPRNA